MLLLSDMKNIILLEKFKQFVFQKPKTKLMVTKLVIGAVFAIIISGGSIAYGKFFDYSMNKKLANLDLTSRAEISQKKLEVAQKKNDVVGNEPLKNNAGTQNEEVKKKQPIVPKNNQIVINEPSSGSNNQPVFGSAESDNVVSNNIEIPITENTIFKNQCGGIGIIVNKSGLVMANKACNDTEYLTWDLDKNKPVNVQYLYPLKSVIKAAQEEYKGFSIEFFYHSNLYGAKGGGLFYRTDGGVTYLDQYATDGFSPNIALYYIIGKKEWAGFPKNDYVWTTLEQNISLKRFLHAPFTTYIPADKQEVYLLYFEGNQPKAVKTRISTKDDKYIYVDSPHKNAVIFDITYGNIMGISPNVNADYFLQIEKLREKATSQGLMFND
jgi:hypothetical protein